MTQEDKSLLLKDLCARLPYGVKFKADNEEDIREIYYIKDENVYTREYQNLPYWIDTIKPLLRPMSSMTEEESKEFESLWNSGFEKALDAQISNCDDNVVRNLEIIASSNAIDFLNKKMFAYRTIDGKDMFELGIAIKAPEGMYNIKEK